MMSMDEQKFSGELAFSQPVINIGSDAGNDIVLIGKNIGNFHAMMYFESNQWYIMPLDSSLKVLQNGLPVTDGGAVLQNGAVLTIGDYRLTMNLNGINTDIIAQYQGMSSGPVSDFSAENDSSSNNLILVINGTPPTEIEPGSAVEFELTATNAGPLVANIQMQLQGIPSAWVQIIPPVLNLNEGRKGSFTVRLSPPRDSSAEAGQYYLHFLISSPNYPRETAFVDTVINLLPYSEFLVNGPTPRSITISRNKPTDVSDVVIINNSNSVTDFVVRSYDDSNELNFTFERGTSGIQGQETVRIRPGDNARVPVRIGAKKLPIFGFTNKNRHYYTNVNPVDRPMDGQSVVGEVVVKPMIRMFWLILILLLLAAAALFIFQPYIFSFQTGSEGKNTQVIMSGSSTGVSWKVSRFASKITVFDGTKETELSRDGSMYFSPTTSTTYTLKAENLLSRFLNITHEKSIQVLVIPQRPTIDVLKVDISDALYNQPVTLTWGVGDNATQARVMANKRVTELAKENYSGSQQQGFTEDTLISLKAINDSGYAMKSVFVNVSPDRIDLNRFTIWVRPNGIAVPNDNDTRRTTRWSALQLMLGTEAPTASPLIRPASVNPQPAAQSNVLDIPDNYNSVPSSPGINPEQWALNGGNPNDLASIVRTPMATANAAELLVGPHLNPTATPTPAATVEMGPSVMVAQTAVPQTSPEGTPYNRDFSIKYAEVVEDPLVESGYRVIEYFPDYQLQKGEQILVEWNVNGVSKVKIENLSGEQLNNTGGEFAYPEKSVTYALEAEVGQIKKVYSLPVRVAGDADDGEGSGLNCDLKASATTLNAPGTVMLTWSGGGNNRVQLISSAKAEADSAEAEKKKEEEAKASGQAYTQPTAGALTGGAIGDWLQPSGFMRVAVEKQTAFMLNAYDGNGNVICTKSVQVNMAGGNDKEDIAASAFRIVKIADDNDVSQKYYAVGQTVHYTIEFSGFPKGKEPTGSVMISDGTSSCSVTLPLTSCAFTAKKAGELTVTAVYSGDNSYKKATATAKETVINKLPTTTMIQSAFKPGASIAEVITQLQFDEGNEYGLIPSGIITFTIGSGTCDLDIVSEKLTCDGDVETDENDSYKFLIKKLALADPAADRIVAAYKGDDYFLPSTSTPVLFRKVPTTIAITGTETYKTGASLANVVSVLNWDSTIFPDYKPTGTVTYTIGSGTCVLELGTKKLSCESASVDKVDSDGKYEMKIGSMLLADNTADRISAAYSGDSIYNASNSTAVLFKKLDTKTQIYNPIKNENRADLETALTYDVTQAHGLTPTGTITYTIIRPDPNHKETTCVLTLGTNTLSCDGTVNYVNRYQITNMLFEDPESDRVKAVYSGDFFFNRSESATVIFGEIIEEDIETQLNIDSAKKNPEGPIDLNISLTWDETLAAGAKPGGTIKITSGTGSCTLNLDSSKPTFTDCNADSVTLEDNVYVIKNLQLIGAGESVEAAYSGGGRFLPSTAAAVYFDRVDTTTAIVMAYKTHGNMPTLVTTLSWNTAEAHEEYPLGTITFKIGTDNCILTLDNDEDAGKVKSFSCEGSDTVVGDGVLTQEGENSILTWTIEKIALSAGNNADRVKATYSGDELFNSSSSKEVVFDTVETEIAISDQTKTPSGLVSLNLDLSWYEEPPVEGMRPTGLITLTSGTKNCTLDISKNPAEFTDCESEKPELDTSDPKHSVYKITGLRMGTNSGIDIKAVYSGDGTFLTSTSQTKEFNKLDTEIVIDKAYKPDSVTLVDILYHLKWKTDESEGKAPSGTITLTIGSDVCKFDLETKKLTGCIGDETPDPIPWNTVTDGDFVGDFTKLVISSTTADRVKVEYSGDNLFNPSSLTTLFVKIDTSISLSNTWKKTITDWYVDFSSALTWDKGQYIEYVCPDESAACKKVPTGTITFTTVKPYNYISTSETQGKCVLDLVTREIDCKNSGQTFEILPDLSMPESIAYAIKQMLLEDQYADRIKAEYSGDSLFNKSVSTMVLFDAGNKINTKLEITDAKKSDNKVTLTAKLTPAENETGTIVFTSGSATCTIDITDHSNVKFEKCSGTAEYKDDGTIEIKDMVMNGTPGDSIYAEYSGDSAYNKSTSPSYTFIKIDTKIAVSKAYKSDSIRAYFNTLLSWDKDEAGDKQPTGTVTFTIGESCKLTIDLNTGNKVKEFSCSDDETQINLASDTNGKFDWTFEKVLLTVGSTADRVKAEYSGDENFYPSTSEFVLFQTIPTMLDITEQSKSSTGAVNLTTTLEWTDDPVEADKVPTGTIKLSMGSNACTLNIGTPPSITDCKFAEGGEVRPDITVAKTLKYTITGLIMGDGTGESIKAEYSGDGLFLASASAAKSFDKYDTELDIEKAYKSGTSYANLNTLLTWNKTEAGDKVPTGTITLTIGGDSCKLTFDGSDGYVKDFTCMEKGTTVITPSSADSASDPDKKTITWDMVKIMLSSGSTADRVKAEYSGDANFNPSTSEFVLFESIPTELKITEMYTLKKESENIHMKMELSWAEEPTEEGKTPTGTINLTVGDSVCTLKITDGSQELTNCTADGITSEVSGKKVTFTIENLAASGLSKNSVSAEYTGDSLFQASKYEHKVDTETVINRALIMPDGTVDFIITSKWDQSLAGYVRELRDKAFRPSGTYKITVGSSSCTLQINAIQDPIFTDCEARQASMPHIGSYPEMYPQFQIYGLKIGDGTASSIKVEYSGDGLFNKSDAEQAFKMTGTELKLDFDQTNKTNDNRVNLVATLTWDSTDLTSLVEPVGPVTFTIGSDSCKLDLTNGSFSCADSSTVIKIFNEYGKPNITNRTVGSKTYKDWTLKLENIKLSDSNTAEQVKGDFAGDKQFNPSSSETKYFDKTDTEITVANAFKSGDIRANWTSVLSWDPAVAGTDVPSGVITFSVGSDSCKLTLDPITGTETNPKKQTNFTCADSTTSVTLDQSTAGQYTLTFTDVLLTAGNTPDRIKADYSGDGLFNASSSDYVLFDTVPTTTRLLNQEKNPGGLVSALVELSWTKDPKAGDLPKGTIKLTSGSAVCTLDLAASPLRFTDCSGSVRVEPEDMESVDKKLTYTITNLNMGSGIGDDIKAEFSGSGSYLPSASDKKSFSKVDTVLVINNAYKPNDPNYANLLSVLSWNNEKAAERVPSGTIKYTVGGGSCELNLSTKKLSCESAADPINMEKIEVDFNTAGFSVAIEKMLLADSNADRVSAEYSGDAVFNPSTASAKLFKKLDTTIDIINAYRDKTTGRASVYARIDWDEAEDEGLKPTGSLKFNLGSGSCTMDLKTKKLSCVGDTMGTISADGHDYGASNLLLTDTDAKIVSVEYSGDAFFNSSVSQQKLFSGLKTTVAVTSASKGCDGENHCFINLSGTLDWEEDVSIIDLPTGKLNIKVGNKTIAFDMDDQTFTGVVAAGADYTSIANQKSFDPTNRHTFEFTNLLLDDVADVNDITVEYSGDEYYGYSTGEGSISKITIETRIDLSLHDFHNNYQGSDEDVWRLRGAIKAANYELPFELTPTGSFTMKGYYEDPIYHDENRDFYKSDFQLDGPVYDLVNNFKVTLKWVVKPNGRYELKFNTGLTGCHEGDLRWVTIKYNGDNSDINLYKESNTATYYAEASNRLELEISKLYQTSYVDPDDQTSKEHFVKHLVLNYKGVNNASDNSFRGTYTFVTNSGSCTLIHDYSGFTDSGTCKIGHKKGYHPIGETSGYLEIEKLELGNLSDTDLTVYFEGNEIYKPSQSAKTPIDRVETTLKLNPNVSSTPVIKNNLLEMDLRLQLTGGHPYLIDYTMPSPEGELVIEVGDDYTCTMDFKREQYNGTTYYYVGTFRENCGSDSVKLELDFWAYRSSNMRFHIKNIPVKDSSVSGFKVSYKGNSLYEASDFSYSFSGKAETTLTLEHNHDAPNLITTNITSPSTVGVPTGKVTYTFAPSGKTCTLSVTDTAHTGITVTNEDCPGGTIEGNPVIENGNVRFILNKQNISGIEGDTMVTAYYNGDSQYSGSEGGTALQVRLIPVTEGLDSSGRLYFNTQDVSVSYPKYPERYSYSYCQQYPDDSTNCRMLEHRFTLTVRIETASGAPSIPTGTKLQFAGEFYGSDSKQCSITPVSSGVYSCSLENIYFTTPGEKTISVSYPEARYFYAESVDFPTMYAISVSSSGSIDTTTIITEPEMLKAGTKVLVKAETKSIADPNDKPGEQIHLFYTYNFSTKERVQTCMETASGAGCELTLTNDTDWVYAEFIGYGAYAPSVGSKQVDGASSSSVSLSVGDLEPIGGN